MRVPVSHPGLAMESGLSALPPTARWVLQTARRLLVEHGFQALTLENIAHEAQENKASIQRYFGSRAGLIETLLDSLVHDMAVSLSTSAGQLPPGESRLRAYVTGLRSMVEDIDAWRAFFEIAPFALRDRALRPRVAALYRWYRQLILESWGVDPSDDPKRQAELDSLASLTLAAMDGLAFQVALEPESVDLDFVFLNLYELLKKNMQDMGEWSVSE